MNGDVASPHRYNTWNYDSIRPGFSGSVGTTDMSIRLKGSSADSPLRFDAVFNGKNSSRSGSNITQGGLTQYFTGGGPPNVVHSAFTSKSNNDTMWNIVSESYPDSFDLDPLVLPVSNLGWREKESNVYKALEPREWTGRPFELGAGEVPRGALGPRIIAVDSGGFQESNQDPQTTSALTIDNIIQAIAGRNSINPTKRYR